MAQPITFVGDLDDAAVRYRRLGFSLTPRYVHPHFGIANHNIVFESDYLELLSPVEKNDRNAERFKLLERDGDGLKDLSLAGPDADAAVASFRAAGLKPLPVIEHHRPVKRPDGTHEARFRIVYLPTDRLLPGLGIHMCQHRTPELVWLQEHQRHANGATGISGLVVAAEHPAEFAATYAALFGVEVERGADGGATVAAGQARLHVVLPGHLGDLFPGIRFRPRPPFVAALELRVDDRDKGISCVAKAGENYRIAPDGAVEVPPDEACGVLIRLREG